MKVTYDKLNDIVSMYYEEEESKGNSVHENEISMGEVEDAERKYEVEEAANLILDTIDLFDKKGKCIGFRVFNASSHYDDILLSVADPEELSKAELKKKPNEKVIAKYSSDKNKIYEQHC